MGVKLKCRGWWLPMALLAGWSGGCVQDAAESVEPSVVEQAVGDGEMTALDSQDLTASADSSCIEPDPLLLEGARQRFELTLSSPAVSFAAADPVALSVTNQTSRGASCELSARFATEHQDGQTGTLGTLDIDAGAIETLQVRGAALGLPSTALKISGRIVFEIACVDTDGADLGGINESLSFHPDGDFWWLYDDSARHDRFEDGLLAEEVRGRAATLRQDGPERIEVEDGNVVWSDVPQITFSRATRVLEVMP